MTKKIIVIGAGAWGTALANVVAENNHNICLIANSQKISDAINTDLHNNTFLPNVKLNANIRSSVDLAGEIKDANYVFIAIPSNAVLDLFAELKHLKSPENCGFVICTKGLEHSSLQFFHQVFEENFAGKNYAILSGPNFAIEVANQQPSITTIASKNENFAFKIIDILKNNYFKPQFSSCVLTAEICGVVKNIMAIACGICDGLDLAQNSKAAILTQGIVEIKILAKFYGINADLASAAGFGDIFLTCATTKSRNNSLGASLARGEKYKDLASRKTYEGAINAASIAKLAQKIGIGLPLCEAINEILREDLGINGIRRRVLAVLS